MSGTVAHQPPKHERQYLRANPPSRLGVIVTDRRRTRTPAGPEPLTDSPSNIEDLKALGATTDVVTAGKFLGISRNTAYRLPRPGTCPLPPVPAGAPSPAPPPPLTAPPPPPNPPAATGHEAP